MLDTNALIIFLCLALLSAADADYIETEFYLKMFDGSEDQIFDGIAKINKATNKPTVSLELINKETNTKLLFNIDKDGKAVISSSDKQYETEFNLAILEKTSVEKLLKQFAKEQGSGENLKIVQGPEWLMHSPSNEVWSLMDGEKIVTSLHQSKLKTDRGAIREAKWNDIFGLSLEVKFNKIRFRPKNSFF